MPFIETSDSTRLFTKDWGSGRPVVLIHGWPLDADMWEYQQPALTEAGFRTVAYDRRGFGRSDQPWSGYDYDTFADDLKAVLDKLDLSDVTLVGFSMGGGEIARYLSRHGGARVSGAVLVSAVTPMLARTADHPEGVDPSVFEGMIDGLNTDRPHFLANFAKTFFGAGVFSSPASSELMEWAGNLAMLASPKATTDCVRAFGWTDFRPDMAAFAVPTLVIHGDADATVPFAVSGQAAAAAISGAELKVYEGAPHAVPFTHAQRLTEDLLAFLRRYRGGVSPALISPGPAGSASSGSVMAKLSIGGGYAGPVILFDAACVLCSANARFILERDEAAVFRLASTQSDIGQSLYRRHGLDPDDPVSMLVVEGGRVFRDSDAVLTIYERLGFPWNLARMLRLVPVAMRDPVYRWVARNRYRLFGRRETCWVAPPEYRDRIL